MLLWIVKRSKSSDYMYIYASLYIYYIFVNRSNYIFYFAVSHVLYLQIKVVVVLARMLVHVCPWDTLKK